MENDATTRIRKLNQQFHYTALQMHEAVSQKAGLSGTDHKYLGFLIEKGEMTAGELATLTGLTTGAVTGLIDRFEKKKLVKRKLAANDRRKVMIVPNTTRIMALFTPLYANYRSELQNMVASFSAKERKAIEAYFSKSIDIMHATIESLR